MTSVRAAGPSHACVSKKAKHVSLYDGIRLLECFQSSRREFRCAFILTAKCGSGTGTSAALFTIHAVLKTAVQHSVRIDAVRSQQTTVLLPFVDNDIA